MSGLQMSLSQTLSSSTTLSAPTQLFLSTKLSHLSLSTTSSREIPFRTTTIRMGGGPRTYPGGVSKWQWKRMQAKKAKQLLKARLGRERQIYEMRKRAELKAAVSELERPWEVVEKAPTLFSVSADDQLKVLADRFQKPGGFDMWSDKDGPELFKPVNGVPSARFFPKGAVHSIKPYGKIENSSDKNDDHGKSGLGPGRSGEKGGDWQVVMQKTGHETINWLNKEQNEESLRANGSRNVQNEISGGKVSGNGMRKRVNRRSYINDAQGISSKEVGTHRGNDLRDRRQDTSGVQEYTRINGLTRAKRDLNLDVYDLSLQKDGSYEFQERN